MRTPALSALLLFIAGILIGVAVELSPFLLLSFSLSAGIAAVVFLLGRRKAAARIALGAGIIATGALLTVLQAEELPASHISKFTSDARRYEIVGRVVSEADIRPDRTFLTVSVDSLTYRSRSLGVTGRVRLRIGEPTSAFDYDDRIRFTAWLSQPADTRNPGAFSYRKYLSLRRIHAIATVTSARQVKLVKSGANEPFIRSLVVPVRTYMVTTFDQHLSPQQSAVVRGFLLGDVRYIPPDVYKRFKDTGTLHVLAASGSNVGYVVATILLLSRVFALPRRHRYLIMTIAVILFSFLAYNQPSVLRATVMAVVALTGLMLYRDNNWLNTISLAAILILGFRPLYLFDLGTQLSFAAAYALVLFMPLVEQILPEKRGIPRKLLRYGLLLFFATVVAQLGVTPILIYQFHTVPIVSFVANLVVVPLVGVVATAAITLVFVSALPVISQLAAWILGFTVDLTLGSILWFENLMIPPLEVGAPEFPQVLFYYLILHFLYLVLRRKRAAVAIGLLAALVLNIILWKDALMEQPSPRITVLDTQETLTAVVEAGDGRTLLINGGGMFRGYDRGENVVVPFLRYRGVKSVEGACITSNYEINLSPVLSILAGLRLFQSPGSGYTGSTGSPDIVRQTGPVVRVSLDELEALFLDGEASALQLDVVGLLPRIVIVSSDLLENEGFVGSLARFQPETLIVATYRSRYRPLNGLNELQQLYPQLRIYTVQKVGAVVVLAKGSDYTVLETAHN